MKISKNMMILCLLAGMQGSYLSAVSFGPAPASNKDVPAPKPGQQQQMPKPGQQQQMPKPGQQQQAPKPEQQQPQKFRKEELTSDALENSSKILEKMLDHATKYIVKAIGGETTNSEDSFATITASQLTSQFMYFIDLNKAIRQSNSSQINEPQINEPQKSNLTADDLRAALDKLLENNDIFWDSNNGSFIEEWYLNFISVISGLSRVGQLNTTLIQNTTAELNGILLERLNGDKGKVELLMNHIAKLIRENQ